MYGGLLKSVSRNMFARLKYEGDPIVYRILRSILGIL